MFSARFFPDVFSFINDGIVTNQLTASGTNSGSAIQVGGSQAVPWRKVGFLLEMALGSTSAGTVTFYLQTATASGGAYATFTTANQSASSVVVSVTGSGKYYLWAEARGEMFTDLGTNGYWVKPVIVQSAVVCPVTLVTLGFVEGSEPASNYNDTGISLTTFYMM